MPREQTPRSDEYGFAAAARVGLDMYDLSCRRTGRTLRLIERVTEEDQIVVHSKEMNDQLTRALSLAGKPKVRVIIVRPGEHPLSRVGTAPQGRTFFDHEFVRLLVENHISEAMASLALWQREMSKTWPHAPDLGESPQSSRMNEFDITMARPSRKG